MTRPLLAGLLCAWILGASAAGARAGVVPAQSAAATTAPAAAHPDVAARLPGTWGLDRVLGPQSAGAVTIVQSAQRWTAHYAGFEEAGSPAGAMTTFRFPGGRGELRVDLARHTGYWLQPPTEFLNAYASPVAFAPLAAGVWRGTIAPLPDRIRAYLVITRAADGSLGAFVRDPFGNAGRVTRAMRVAVDGPRIRLIGAKRQFEAALDVEHDVLSVVLPPFPGTSDFTRRDALHAEGLFPRTPMPARLSARAPLPAGDGWRIGTLQAAGLKAAPLEDWLNQVLSTQPDLRAPYVQSIQIARHGKLVLDEYFYGFAADQPHDMRSAGKTLDDVLVGVAQYRGARIDETTPMAPFFRGYAPFAHDDARKARITVGHLLTMTSGLACDDYDDDSPGQEDRVQETPDWYRTTLDLPVVHDPGTHAAYCSQAQNLLGGVLTETTHTWLPAFFHDAVARELQWRDYYVPMMPTGSMYLGGGEYVRPRDFLKLGQLMLDGGVWNGKRLMSRAWVERSLRSHASLTSPGDYGYAWHVYTFRAGGRTYRAEQAGGNGGQMLFIVRDLDLAVLITAGNYGDFETWNRFGEFIPRYVIPAAV